MRNQSFIQFLLVFYCLSIFLSQSYGKDNLKLGRDSVILNLDFDGSDFKLYENLNFEDNGYMPTKTIYGILPSARIEGHSLTTIKQISVISSESKDGGNAIQYTLGPQILTDHKARAEHYLFVGDFGKIYVSEFSLKLDPNFTPIMEKRIDGGTAWCCLRQWHQSSPESPPMALDLKVGTNNVIYTNFLSGTYKTGPDNKSYRSTEKTLQLGKWYHFRYEWRIDPGTDNSFCKIWMSDTRMGNQMTDADIWCDYKGRIGYSLVGKPASEIGALSWKIREQQGLYQNSHIGANSFHAVIYDNVKICIKSH